MNHIQNPNKLAEQKCTNKLISTLQYFQFEKQTKHHFTNEFSQFMIICGFNLHLHLQ